MQLFTPVDIEKSPLPITHDTPVMLLGSCFSDSISRRMSAQLFSVTPNPLGTLYNPLSILKCLKILTSGRQLTEADLTYHGGLYHSYLCHSRLSHPTAEATLTAINTAITEASEELRHVSHIFITLGTALVYTLKENGEVVANCHKMPAGIFTRRMLGVEEAAQALRDCIATIRSVNTDARIIFTVSPIRHLSDGARLNTLSKSTLHLATSLVDGAEYFPAFEIINDELRDYRFYAADMAHPSEVAADIVYERFSQSFYSPATHSVAAECARLARRIAHRPLTTNTEAIQAFRNQTMQAAEALIAKYPSVKSAVTRLLTTYTYTS